ncbi:hypothetical protein BJ875DRAFT_513529 [Amylocarpus encephaloides]|uniref:Uncharacterized protein n=1 Tax=Amylocarpus encephaloides TaxID=45428 RepID=A0A9P7YFU4_9HELO|nr:hypothetical protein BJ875DRAFT_513529 [Amylocarpus encephaloides]
MANSPRPAHDSDLHHHHPHPERGKPNHHPPLEMRGLLPLLAWALTALACSHAIAESCCSSAYQGEMACESNIYAKYGYDGGRTVGRALRRCADAYQESCEEYLDGEGVQRNTGLVVADLREWGITLPGGSEGGEGESGGRGKVLENPEEGDALGMGS